MMSLLIVDSRPDRLDLLSKALAQPDLRVLATSDPAAGLETFLRRRPQLVLVRVRSKKTGLHLLQRIVQIDPDVAVILTATDYSDEDAIEAMRNGASDYLHEPVFLPFLKERVCQLLQKTRKPQIRPELESQGRAGREFEGIVGRSQKMCDMFSRIRRMAPHYRASLITGETGTGKELVARAIHNLSPAASHRFVVLNCSAVVETLFESELFGHVKGSFTGATQDKPGLFQHAHSGTLFLDEIGDMPLATQAKLLRVLQNQEVQRVGALATEHVDVRVLAATNHDLLSLIAAKRFREDLYYRLSMVVIQTPRLAERKEDLPLLVSHFVARFAAEYGKEIRGVTHRAEMRLAQHSWPGNVRELENVICHAAMMTLSDTIDVSDLHEYLQTPAGHQEEQAPPTVLGADSLETQERVLIMRALESARGNQTEAARILHISRDRLRYKVKKYRLNRPASRQAFVAAV